MTTDETLRVHVLTMPIDELRERVAALSYFGLPDMEVTVTTTTEDDAEEEWDRPGDPAKALTTDDDEKKQAELAQLTSNDEAAPLNDLIPADELAVMRFVLAVKLARQGAGKTVIAERIRQEFPGTTRGVARSWASAAYESHQRDIQLANGRDTTAA